MAPNALTSVDKKTIEDFGEQWTEYQDNPGYYGSLNCLIDIFGPVMNAKEVVGKRVMEIGSGTGRIVNMLLDAGAGHVVAVEPSAAAQVLEKNVAERANRVTVLVMPGDAIPPSNDLDIVTSIGVLHHIVDPSPVVAASYAALKPGGKMLIWLYGHEGNELYLAIFETVRAVTKVIPGWLLWKLCWLLNLAAFAYGTLCNFLPLPMQKYFQSHYMKLGFDQQVLTIYDQLNPAHAKYYYRDEAQALLENAGFKDVQLYHRHKYSWTVVGTKPI